MLDHFLFLFITFLIWPYTTFVAVTVLMRNPSHIFSSEALYPYAFFFLYNILNDKEDYEKLVKFLASTKKTQIIYSYLMTEARAPVSVCISLIFVLCLYFHYKIYELDNCLLNVLNTFFFLFGLVCFLHVSYLFCCYLISEIRNGLLFLTKFKEDVQLEVLKEVVVKTQ